MSEIEGQVDAEPHRFSTLYVCIAKGFEIERFVIGSQQVADPKFQGNAFPYQGYPHIQQVVKVLPVGVLLVPVDRAHSTVEQVEGDPVEEDLRPYGFSDLQREGVARDVGDPVAAVIG